MLCLIASNGFSQFVTQGNGKLFRLSDLADSTGNGVITVQNGICSIFQDITLSSTDSLLIETDVHTICFHGDISLNIEGQIICAKRDDTLLVSGKTDSNRTGYTWRFSNAPEGRLCRLHFEKGKSIILNNSNISIDSCLFNGFSAQVISYTNCNPAISNCHFFDNQMEAIQSAANTKGSPTICNNLFERNVLSNSNRPQINLGPGEQDSIHIIGNRIIGTSSMSGGIAISDLLGYSQTIVLLQDNRIEHNRYGYTQQGYNIYAQIRNNEFVDNNLETNPMNGGSDISILGYDTTCQAIIRHNLIHGNYWGITAIYRHKIDMGTAYYPGGNVIYDNQNEGNTYALYNNSTYDISAIGNYWGNNDSEWVESVIYHETDAAEFGAVEYMPFTELHPEIVGFKLLLEGPYGPEGDYEKEGGIWPERRQCFIGRMDDYKEVMIEVPFGVTYELIQTISGFPDDTLRYMLHTPHGDSAMWEIIIAWEGNVDEPDQPTVKYYPNPVTDNKLFIENPSIETVTLRIYNTEGKQIYQGNHCEELIEIYTTNWKPGFYLFILDQGKQRSYGKFVVQ